VRSYTTVLRQRKRFSEEKYVSKINKWLHQVTLGLEYLHEEGIVHGDLHGGYTLIDADDNARLTDFGLGVIADAIPLNYAYKHGGGGFAHRAPELHDPDAFKTKSARPTISSDMYAFACTAVELYTQQQPFPGMSFFLLGKAVVSGDRPRRPSTVNGTIMSDALWDLTNRWRQEPRQRPPIKDVARDMGVIVSETSSELPTHPNPQSTLEDHPSGCQCYIA